MAKFGRPLKGIVYVSQTYHGASNKAIDLSGIAGAPVLAVADGKISYRSSGSGSYCIQTVTNSTLKVYYVHTYKWLPTGTAVKKGDVICYIAPTTLNGGHPTHLHLGLPYPHGVMGYFDRNITFATKYADIKASWFNNTSTLNWSLFKNLDYTTLKPEVITPPVDDCEQRVAILRDSFDALTSDYRALQDQYLKLSDEAKLMVAENVELHIQMKKANEDYGTLMIERNRLENEKNEAIAALQGGALTEVSTSEIFSELWKRITRSVK